VKDGPFQKRILVQQGLSIASHKKVISGFAFLIRSIKIGMILSPVTSACDSGASAIATLILSEPIRVVVTSKPSEELEESGCNDWGSHSMQIRVSRALITYGADSQLFILKLVGV